MNTEKEAQAIQILKTFEPQTEPYYLCYSGGKDSDCIRILADLAGVKHDIVHNLTTVDAPETVRYVKSIPNVQICYPEKTMWQLIPEYCIPPLRLMRYCCEELKEHGGKFRRKVTGVRWAESRNRANNSGKVLVIGKKQTVKAEAEKHGVEVTETPKQGLILNHDNAETRNVVENCYRTTSTLINPIVDWTDRDVWDFLHHYGCESNPLYQCGFKRIGCIGCPMASKHRYAEFRRYPKYKQMYIHAFDRMLKERERRHLPNFNGWETGEAVFKWWMGEDVNQLSLFDLENYL